MLKFILGKDLQLIILNLINKLLFYKIISGGLMMQLYLCKPFKKTSVNDRVKVDFTGTKLRLFFNGNLAESIDAAPGECWYIQLRTQLKYPVAEKAKMPCERGKKILWALDFVQARKHADSYEDFMERMYEVAESYNPSKIFFETSSQYAFMFGKKKTKNGVKLQPLFGWVADDISDYELEKLMIAYKRYHHIHCGEEFLKLL